MARVAESIFRYLTDDGLVADGTNDDMHVDGSSTTVPFYIGPPSGKYWDIHRMIIFIQDGGAGKVGDYGSITGGLTNGMTVHVHTGGIGGTDILDLLDGETIKTNGEWISICYDVTIAQPGAGDTYVGARWTFEKSGVPLRLSGHRNEVLIVDVNDNLTALVDHRAFIQGVELDSNTT
jgi:hypothetical protein